VANESTNQRWLRQVHEIIERMRLLLGDYSRVASEEDDEYQMYSPFLNSSMYDTELIEFDLGEHLIEPAKHHSVSARALRWLGIKASHRVNDNLDSWKWALVEKRKFAKVLAGLQEENRRLKDILPLMSGFNTIPAVESRPDRDEDTRRLGLLAHRQLQKIVSDEGNSSTFAFFEEHLKPTGSCQKGPLILCDALVRGSKPHRVLVEYKQYRDRSDQTKEEIQIDRCRAHQLASLLASAGDSDLATLPFRGLLEEPSLERHTFAFNYPSDTDNSRPPISLHELIQMNNIDIRLNLPRRFHVSAKIARSIAAFHSDGWVHKSLRSDSIVFFQQAQTQNLLVQHPYLVNFEYSRPQAGTTRLDFDNDYERNLYRHPERQGQPTTSFTKLHDLYALGVVLLEIGLWQTVASMVKEVTVRSGRQSSVQGILKQLCKRRLSHHMGPMYAQATLACIDDRFEHQIADVDFSMVFHDEVIKKLDVRALMES